MLNMPLSRSLFRLLVLISICIIFTVLLVSIPQLGGSRYDTAQLEADFFYREYLHEDEPYYADDTLSFKSRKLKEFEYKEKLYELNPGEVDKLNKQYHRNITIQWGRRQLLPHSKPIYGVKCLDYLDKDYRVRVSIVIPYHDEVVPMLLRTLTTIVHRTLPKYLHEIILIDDFSSVNDTEEILEYCASQRFPVRLLHNQEQLGIANSRLKGIRAAQGDVVVILDSHIEVSDLWLEPLLDIITQYPKSVAVPCLQMISERDYETQSDRSLCQHYVTKVQKGFGIIGMEHPILAADYVKTDPYPSSAMLGGALAAYKSTLLEYYPEGIMSTTWSIENNRLSFRVWLCGEGIWMTTCSQVMHANGMDENLSRYSIGADEQHNLFDKLVSESLSEILNYMSSAEQKEKIISKFTMNEKFKKLIYENADDIRKSFDPQEKECKDYSYYTSNVVERFFTWQRDMFRYVGMVQSLKNTDICIDVMDMKVGAYPCRHYVPMVNDAQVLGFTLNNAVRSADLETWCWDTATYEEGTAVAMFGCHVATSVHGTHADSQHFIYHNLTKQIEHVPSSRCLTLAEQGPPLLFKCNFTEQAQKWSIKLSPWF